jgi:membrane protein
MTSAKRSKPRSFLGEVVYETGRDAVTRLAAALAYFAVLAMPGLLVLVLGVAGSLYDFDVARTRIVGEMEALLGAEGGRTVDAMVATASAPKGSSWTGRILGIASLVLGATGFFVHLQGALDSIWNAKPPPHRSGILGEVVARVFSFGMLIAMGLLLLISLVLSAALAALGDRITRWVGDTVSTTVVEVGNVAVTWVLFTLLFMALFKVMPNAKIGWREVRFGAAVTAALMVVGKSAIGFYLGRSDPGAAYGAAGPLAVILIWVYYSSLIVLVGAELTEVHARRRAHRGSRATAREHRSDA